MARKSLVKYKLSGYFRSCLAARVAIMGGIFINYRRDDAPGVAGRLFDQLARSFPRRDLFMDVDAIKPGLDFVKQLDAQVAQCDVLLALVGPHWLHAKDQSGNRRLEGDKDYVRIEIASALERDIPVIPVLIDGTEMPPEGSLPDDLKNLTRRQSLELRHTRFTSDANAIVLALKDCLPKRSKPWVWPLAALALIGIVGLSAALYFWRGGPVLEEAPPRAALVGPLAAPPIPQAVTKDRSAATPKASPSATTQVRVENLEDLRVAFGDTFDKVRFAYPSAETISGSDGKPQSLKLPSSGLQFFFADDGTLYNTRMDPPFAGSVHGIRIGDSRDDLFKVLGPPHRDPWDFGSDKAYLYRINGANVRYDINPKGKVATIFYLKP